VISHLHWYLQRAVSERIVVSHTAVDHEELTDRILIRKNQVVDPDEHELADPDDEPIEVGLR
jgi:hypothetical protein